jgi:guanylate kinase
MLKQYIKGSNLKLLIAIVGGSGSGKSTLEDEIIIHDGFRKAVSYTTRDKRNGEHNGREYHFVTEQEFNKAVDNNEMLEHITFAGNNYGLSKKEFEKNDDHLVFVVEPNGLNQILDYIDLNNLEVEPLIIFMNINEKERFKNMVKRGDNPVDIQERLKQETIVSDFKEFGISPQITISKLNETISETVVEDIYKYIEYIQK